jgi:hypothetical protein
MLKINVVRETLSDGSTVFNVHLGNLVLHALSRDDALALAQEMADAIDARTVEVCRVGASW